MIGFVMLFVAPPIGIGIIIFAYLRQVGDEQREEDRARERYEAYLKQQEKVENKY